LSEEPFRYLMSSKGTSGNEPDSLFCWGDRSCALLFSTPMPYCQYSFALRRVPSWNSAGQQDRPHDRFDQFLIWRCCLCAFIPMFLGPVSALTRPYGIIIRNQLPPAITSAKSLPIAIYLGLIYSLTHIAHLQVKMYNYLSQINHTNSH